MQQFKEKLGEKQGRRRQRFLRFLREIAKIEIPQALAFRGEGRLPRLLKQCPPKNYSKRPPLPEMGTNSFRNKFAAELLLLKQKHGYGAFSWAEGMTRKAARKIARKLARQRLSRVPTSTYSTPPSCEMLEEWGRLANAAHRGA